MYHHDLSSQLNSSKLRGNGPSSSSLNGTHFLINLLILMQVKKLKNLMLVKKLTAVNSHLGT